MPEPQTLGPNTTTPQNAAIVEIDRARALEELGLSDDEFIDLCILCGCDYAGSIRGIGAVRALQYIKVRGRVRTLPRMETRVCSSCGCGCAMQTVRSGAAGPPPPRMCAYVCPRVRRAPLRGCMCGAERRRGWLRQQGRPGNLLRTACPTTPPPRQRVPTHLPTHQGSTWDCRCMQMVVFAISCVCMSCPSQLVPSGLTQSPGGPAAPAQPRAPSP